MALRDYLNARGEFYVVYANVEGGQSARNDVDQVPATVISVISSRLKLILQNDLPETIRKKVMVDTPASDRVRVYLEELCVALDRPLILFLDEIDALVGDSLVNVLRQIRAGYDQRPEYFPQSIILCGVRDVRDYRIVLSNQDIITGGSAFNIKAESLRLGNFSLEEIHDLYRQHTAATGQEFDPACFPQIWEATEGHFILFNRDKEVLWDEKIWHRKEQYGPYAIAVWGM